MLVFLFFLKNTLRVYNSITMSLEKHFHEDIKEYNKECVVCFQKFDRLYQISDCRHFFCENCSISYIISQSNNFSSAKCLQQGCNKLLDEKKQIFTKLPAETIKKIKKHELFLFIQKNPQYKQCSDQNCLGYFPKNSLTCIQCNKCLKPHCNKCFKLKHEGQCVIQNDRQIMGNLNYKRCPRCQIWIQKSQGCNYIDCKCGCKFCYKCGNQFDRDPCRNQNLWKNGLQIRKKLQQIKLRQPKTPGETILFLPKLILQLILSVVFTVLISISTLALGCILYVLLALFCPLGLLILSTQFEGYKKNLYIVSIIIFYPILIGLFALTLMVITLLYPCLRKTYHHGVYDPYDQGLSKISLCYVSTMASIWSF